MILRKLIRQIIKESLLVEKYKEGDVMLGSFADAIQNTEEPYEDDEEVYDYDNSKSTSSTPSSSQQKDISSTPSSNTRNNNPNTAFEDLDLGSNRVQFKEGFEVSRSGEKKITITNLRGSNFKRYNLQVSGHIVKIEKIFLVAKGDNLQFQMTASKSVITRTAIMDDQNKKDIISNFLLDKNNFDITGKDTEGKEATVTFIKI